MIAAGGACGISTAFGAPIGGALFAFEISKPNTFWTFNMLWKIFLATSTAVLTFSLLNSLGLGAPLSMSDGAALKFGDVTQIGQNSILDLPAALILGVVGGLLGAFFINITLWNSIWRKKFVTTPWRKVFECIAFAFVTSSVFYGVVCARKNNCKPIADAEANQYEIVWECSEGYYNPLATLILNTEKGTLVEMFRYP